MIKILIAVDSFKGSLSSKEAAKRIADGLILANPEIEIIKVPLADGGEGTVEAVIDAVGGEYITLEVCNPLFRKTTATYGLIDQGKTAILEMAAASGITLLNSEEKNPMLTTTFGTGELIVDAVKRGVANIIVGIGGSATNDGGTGMASALGVKFYDDKKNVLRGTGGSLKNLATIDLSGRIKGLENVHVTVICDVTNPLCGMNGASYVYGPQKGATEEMVKELDSNMIHLSKIVERDLGKAIKDTPGAGAAGGLGFGLMAFTDAKLTSGIDFMIEFLKLEEKIKHVDVVITGEGKMDNQTQYNKAPWGIMQIARKYNKKIIGVAGMIDEHAKASLIEKYDYLYSIQELAKSTEDSILNAGRYLSELASIMYSDIT